MVWKGGFDGAPLGKDSSVCFLTDRSLYVYIYIKCLILYVYLGETLSGAFWDSQGDCVWNLLSGMGNLLRWT